MASDAPDWAAAAKSVVNSVNADMLYMRVSRCSLPVISPHRLIS
jgi:hypothetical protein